MSRIYELAVISGVMDASLELEKSQRRSKPKIIVFSRGKKIRNYCSTAKFSQFKIATLDSEPE
jgi:hypothetical protein